MPVPPPPLPFPTQGLIRLTCLSSRGVLSSEPGLTAQASSETPSPPQTLKSHPSGSIPPSSPLHFRSHLLYSQPPRSHSLLNISTVTAATPALHVSRPRRSRGPLLHTPNLGPLCLPVCPPPLPSELSAAWAGARQTLPLLRLLLTSSFPHGPRSRPPGRTPGAPS